MDPEIAAIEVDRAAMRLRLHWDDGVDGALDLVAVRLACPCAACRGARDHGAETWPGPHSPVPLGVESAELVGAWGLSIRWNDGHQTGIYPFDSLRDWVSSGRIALAPDSGLGGTDPEG